MSGLPDPKKKISRNHRGGLGKKAKKGEKPQIILGWRLMIPGKKRKKRKILICLKGNRDIFGNSQLEASYGAPNALSS